MADIKLEIGMGLEKLREAHGYSREEIGFRIGKSRKTIYAYEKGTIDISVTVLQDILSIYNETLSRFLDRVA